MGFCRLILSIGLILGLPERGCCAFLMVLEEHDHGFVKFFLFFEVVSVTLFCHGIFRICFSIGNWDEERC